MWKLKHEYADANKWRLCVSHHLLPRESVRKKWRSWFVENDFRDSHFLKKQLLSWAPDVFFLKENSYKFKHSPNLRNFGLHHHAISSQGKNTHHKVKKYSTTRVGVKEPFLEHKTGILGSQKLSSHPKTEPLAGWDAKQSYVHTVQFAARTFDSS